MKPIQNICLLGFGEVGRTLAEDLNAFPNVQLTAFDRLFSEKKSLASNNLQICPQVVGYQHATDAVAQAELVISAVTAAQDLKAAQSVASALPAGSWFLDLNSVAPETKQSVAALIEEAGGRYVEAAVMSPIHPLRSKSPILLGGPHAREFVEIGQALGFMGTRFCDEALGIASATKMCRSVMIKGLEALVSARHYGVEQEVLSSLNNLFPMENWSRRAHYMITRTLEHGVRRAEEMRQVALTVQAAGLEPRMSQATAERQKWAPQFSAALEQKELLPLLDNMLTQLHSHEEKSKC
ncbi:MAG: 6-phosphogluconate dehydrogenase [Deltaproteobacteria bacterium]|nr:6-phosphogluconate dehydrogenase [Deltaproteobacteria bacterium]